MQPPSQDPMNPIGQSSFSSQSEQPSAPLAPDSLSPTSQRYQPSSYPQTGPQFASPPPLSAPQGSYPPGEEAYYNRISPDGGSITQYRAETQGKLDALPMPPRKPGNGWKVVSLILFILVLILGTATTALVLTRPSSSKGQQLGQVPTPVATQSILQTPPTSVATQAAQPTPTTSLSNNYSAAQPGPGCDTSGGTWTVQGSITNIACGTTVTSNPTSTWGYLSLQLPSNKAFSSNNKISIAGGNLATDLESGYNCLGLAEQGSNTGFLGTYCGNGKWFIYSISNTGAIIQTLDQGITSTRTTEQISLSLQGTTLSLVIDTETHKISISSISPTQVAIAVSEPGDTSISIENFSYITPAS